MKILIVNWQDIKNKFSGGAEVHLFEIFGRIAKKGHKVTLVCCRLRDLPKVEIINDIEVIRIGNRQLFNLFFIRYYLSKLKNLDFDIVIDDINKIPFFTPFYVRKPILGILHHFFGKTIFREVNPLVGLYVVISEKLMDFIYKKTPFVVVSDSTKEELIKRKYNPSLINVVYNALNPTMFPFKIQQKFEMPTITYFGRLKKYKSIDHLLYAFQIILKELPNSQLFIVGDGDYLTKLQSIAKRLKITENVKFWGYVNENQKIELLSRSHCVVNTSIKEGWGITNLESNACGTPVISANVPGLRDSVKDGFSGLLYPYGNIEELANKILLVLRDNHLREELSQGALEWSMNFTWDKSADQMLDIIQTVLRMS
ncbi:MAG: glycosyltransferase family 4 protein [Candidatus Kapaibacteriales bacterium]